jgi:streptogramin lyase
VLLIFIILGATISNTYGSETYVFVRKWGTEGSDNGQFQEPVSVAVGSSSIIYVVDSGNARIQKFDNNGNFISKWGSQGSGDAQFHRPYSIAVDSLGKVYVADLENYQIQKFDSDGTFIKKWGSVGNGNGQLNGPTGISIDSHDNVYVAEIHNFRIQKFDSNGNFLTKWGTQGSGDGQFSNLEDVAVDSSDNVYAADYLNHRIQKFDSNGNFLAKWGSQGSGDGQFQGALDVAIDSHDNAYVVDLGNQRIQKFDKGGNFLATWGSYGTQDGQFRNPYGVGVDNEGNVYVADYFNDRVQVFAKSENVKPTVMAQPIGGSYKLAQLVTLTASEQATIYYTTDGSNPTTRSQHGMSPVSGISIDRDGQTKLMFFAIDTAGNAGDVKTEIYTIDKTAPIVSVPSDIIIESTSSSGAVVKYAATAHDNLDGDLTPTCSPSSGSIFAIGNTIVNCKATDKAGNTGTASFNILVKQSQNPAGEPTSLFLKMNPNRGVAAGQDFSLSGRLVNSQSRATSFAGLTISFTIEPSSISIPSTQTDKQGKFSMSGLKAPSEGSYEIVAHFAGTSLLKPSESSAVVLKVEKHTTSLKLEIKGNPSSASLSGVLIDTSTGKGITNKIISFTTDRPSLIIHDASTDSKGQYKTSVPQLQCGTGTINIQSHFVGNNDLKHSDSKTLKLKLSDCPTRQITLHQIKNVTKTGEGQHLP